MTRLALIAAAVVTAIATVAVAAAADARPARYACYPAQFSAFLPQARAYVDALAQQRVAVSAAAPQHVCAPAAPRELADVPTSYLACYRVAVAPGFEARNVRMRDDLGTLSMRALRLSALCLRSARVDLNSPRAPSEMYACYAVKPLASLGGKQTDVADAFGASRESVALPERLCAPATKVGATPVARPYLTCYGVESDVKAETVVVQNELGVLKAALGPRDQLCTAATRL